MKKDLEFIKKALKNSFDVKYREIDSVIGDATIIFADVLCSTAFISDYIIKPLIEKNEREIKTEEDILSKVLNINIVGFAKDIDDAIFHIISGDAIIIFNELEKIIYCETKSFVKRSVNIPVTEAVIKGPREGFTEAFVDNVALIRRRIKNKDLKFESIFSGEKSNTVICMAYIDKVAPPEVIDYVRNKIKNMKYEFILDTNYIETELRAKKTIFDTVGYTEKADELSAKILEGRVAVIVDGTPFVITVPYFFLENFQNPDDYYMNRYFVMFTRGLRWIAFFIAMFLPGIYVAFAAYHLSMVPSMFVFRLAVSRAGVPFPIVVEVLIMMLFFQLIKEAGLRLPQPIGSAMSIVSALILGDSAVGAGLASRITILIVAMSTLSYFLIPKIYNAISIWSLGIVITASLLGFPGFFFTVLILVAHLADLESVGYPYLFPLGTAKEYKMRDCILRGPLKKISKGLAEEENEGLIKDEKNNKS